MLYFSFRKHRRAKRAREKERRLFFSSPTTTPLRWRSINPLWFIFYHPRSTDFEEKIEDPWTGYLPTRINNNRRKLRCVSRSTHDLSMWNKPLIDTCQYCSTSRANQALRLLANADFQNLQRFPSFLPLSLPRLSFFSSRFISRAAKTENPLPRSFLAPKLNGNACYAGSDIRYLFVSAEQSK